jgi:hypothetical protein
MSSTPKEPTMSNSTTHHDESQDTESEQHTDEPVTKDDKDDGAPAPFAPDSDDDSPLGDTDEHSDA